jgi:Mycothiol maleylpyruvate isomerase N-terminal domain.
MVESTARVRIPAGRPDQSEYPPYFHSYVSLVPDGDILDELTRQGQASIELLSSVPEEKGGFRYAPGKWSIKEALGHVIDAERIFSYRALRISRNDPTPLASFEQDTYIEFGPFSQCSLRELIDEFQVVRQSTLYLFRALDPSAWMRQGTVNNYTITVRALAYVTAGHAMHHMTILRERYLRA